MAEQGPSALDVAKLAKFGVEQFAPETYASLTNWLPSLGDIGSSLGMEWLLGGAPVMEGGGVAAGSGLAGGAAGAGMGALGGLGMASLYAAPAMILAALGAMYGDTGDQTLNSQGAGVGNLASGTFTPKIGGAKLAEAAGLFDDYAGDGSWYQGGDATLVSDKPIDVGSMSIKSDMPYWSVGGAPYESPELAIASGRQISRGEMGMPVEYEPLYNMYDPRGQAPEISEMILNRSLPVYDAPANLPSNWDSMIDIRNQLGTGEGQNSSDIRYDAWYAGLNPRQRQWADMGLNTGQLYKFTGAETSPDANPIPKNESPMPGAVAETPPPAAVDPVQASLDANARATAALPQKFTPEQMQKWLTYGQGPEALLGRPLDLATIIGS
jgi:hypothetical protein